MGKNWDDESVDDLLKYNVGDTIKGNVPTSSGYTSYLTAQDILSTGYSGGKATSATGGGGGTSLPGYLNPPNQSKMIAPRDMPTLSLPTYAAPEFKAPEQDENRLRSLKQQAASSGIRKLRRHTDMAILSTRGMPHQARKMTLREALAGYGEGMSGVMNAAGREGRAEYNQEYQRQYNETMTNYQGRAMESQTNFQTKVSQAQAQYKAELERLWTNAKL